MHHHHIIELTLLLTLIFSLQDSVLGDFEGGKTNWMPNEDSWHYWWSYSGISGPAYWGLLNLDWYICDKGRQQSPINIETKQLVYDPHLSSLKVDSNLISGLLYNDGHAIVFNSSISPFVLESIKTNSEMNKGKQSNNNSLTKRNTDNDLGIFNNLNSISLDLGSGEKDSSSALMDLSNSIELSMKQNDRLSNNNSTSTNSIVNNSGDTENEIDSADGNAINDHSQLEDPSPKVHFTGAGLTYPYKFEALYLRFGSESSEFGSEHRINSHAYVAELQLMAYNSLLYKSYAEASTKPQGLLAIAILIDLMPSNETGSGAHQGEKSRVNQLNSALESLLIKSANLKHRGSSVVVRGFNLTALLPETDFFVSYEGSLTTPGCQESVNWLVLNKPLYITRTNLNILRTISADEQSNAPTGTLIADNIRPVQSTNQRLIRTSIRPPSSSENPETCQRLWTKYEFKLTKDAKLDNKIN